MGRLLLIAVVTAGIAVLAIRPIFNGRPLGFGHYYSPVWSPDGSQLAFSFESGLWVYQVDAGEFHRLRVQSTVQDYRGLAWLDSDTVVYIARFQHQTGLYRTEVSSNQTSKLTDIDWWGWIGFAFNPQREAIIFSQTPQFSTVSNPVMNDLYSLDLNSLAVTRLTDTPEIGEADPTWSPDRRYYASRWDGIMVVEPTTDEAYTVDAGVNYGVHRYTWSPDGQWFLYVGDEAGEGPGLFLTASDGNGEPRLILSGPILQVAWSPSGSYIAYTTITALGWGNELYIVPAEQFGLALPIESSDVFARD